MNTNSLKTNFIMNLIMNISSVLFPVICFPYIYRVLLPEGVGRVSFAMSVMTYLLMLIQLGVPTYGIKEVAKVREDKEKLSLVVQSLLCINVVLLVVVYGGFVVLTCLVKKIAEEKLLYYILSISLIIDVFGVEWLFRGLEKYTYITIRSLVFKLFSLVCIFCFVHSYSDYSIYAFFLVLASSGARVCNLFLLKKSLCHIEISIHEIKKHIKPVLILFAMNIATIVYTNLDIIMVGIMNTDSDVGYYSTAVNIRGGLLVLVTSLGAVMLPRTTYCLQRGLKDDFLALSKSAIHFVSMIAIPITAFLIIVAAIGIKIYAGERFAPSAIALRIIAPTLLFVGWTNITGIQMLIPLDKEKMVMTSVVIGAMIDFVLNLFLIPKYSAGGAALSTVIAEIAVLIVQLKALGREYVSYIFAQRWGVYFSACGISSFLCLIVIKLWRGGDVALFLLLFSVFFGLYGMILLFKNDIMMIEAVVLIKNKIMGMKKK